MAGERRLRILARLAANGERAPDMARLCTVSAELTATSGAGIMLMSGDVPKGSVGTTGAVSALIEDLQFTYGEGPSIDAYQQDRPVFEPDLRNGNAPRWLAFTAPALDAGVRAVFGFPMRVGAVRLGAINLYRNEPGPLTDEQHADALVMADIAAQAILVLQTDAAPGQLAEALEAGADFQYVVHQAAGMVAVQLDVSVGQALIRLRAHAFGGNLPLAEIARAVVARQLRFDTENGPEP